MKIKNLTAFGLVTLTVLAISIPYLVINAKEKESIDYSKHIIKRDIYTEVFGEDSGTDFVPAYYTSNYEYDEDIPLSADVQFEIARICEDNSICYELVLAIIEKESNYKIDAVNHNGKCHGLMQIDTRYHKCANPYDPIENVRAGVKYLNELFTQYEDNSLVLDIYNGNANAFSNFEKGVLSKYADDVLMRAEQLERKHGKVWE